MVSFGSFQVLQMVILPAVLRHSLVVASTWIGQAINGSVVLISTILQIVVFALTVSDYMNNKIGKDQLIIASVGLGLSLVYTAAIIGSMFFTVGLPTAAFALAIPILGVAMFVFTAFVNIYFINTALGEVDKHLPMSSAERWKERALLFFTFDVSPKLQYTLNSKQWTQMNSDYAVSFLKNNSDFDAFALPRNMYYIKDYEIHNVPTLGVMKYPVRINESANIAEHVVMGFSNISMQNKFRDSPSLPHLYRLLCMGKGRMKIDTLDEYQAYNCTGSIAIGKRLKEVKNIFITLPGPVKTARVKLDSLIFAVIDVGCVRSNFQFGKKGGLLILEGEHFKTGHIDSSGPLSLMVSNTFYENSTVYFSESQMVLTADVNKTFRLPDKSDLSVERFFKSRLNGMQPKLTINVTERLQLFTGRESGVEFLIVKCGLKAIATKGGKSENDYDRVIISPESICTNTTEIHVFPYTLIENYAQNGSFIYVVPPQTIPLWSHFHLPIQLLMLYWPITQFKE